MANGSFGLSGLPTAPTTVGSAPNNALSPVSAVVNSTAGFQAGDLVYNFGGDIQPVPGNYTGSATFPIVDNLPTSVANVAYGELYPSPYTKGYAFKDLTVAKLTDGNIVMVYLSNASSNGNQPYFKVVSESGAVVVTDTRISTNAASFGGISVCALTGGGFVVAWPNTSSQNVWYAIYANPSGGSCAVTLAAFQDTGLTINGSSGNWTQVVARPNGSWIVAVVDTTPNIAHKVLSATGVQVYAWTTTAANLILGQTSFFKYVTRSDNTFVIVYIGASTQFNYIVYSAINTVAKANAVLTSVATPSTANNAGSVEVFSNDITLVNFATGSTPYYITISAANVAGTATAYTIADYPSSGSVYWTKTKILASGNYILTFASQVASVDTPYSWVLNYIIYNSSHVLQQSYRTIASFSLSSSFVPNIVETTNFINILTIPSQLNTSTQNGWNQASFGLQWAKVSPVTYATVKNSTISATVANTGAQLVSGYARSASTPTTAAFFASTTGTVSTTLTAGAFVVSQTTIDSGGTCDAIDTASLTDGSCLILYRVVGGTYPIKLVVISPAGVLTATYTLVSAAYTAAWGNARGALKLAVLTDGKIAVTYVQAGGTQALMILSSTYSVLTSNTSLGTVGSAQNGYGIAPLSNNRFAFVFRNTSGNVTYRIYDSSLTALVGDTNIYSTNNNNSAVSAAAAPNVGGFLVTWSNPTDACYFSTTFQETSTNVFAQSSNTQNSQGGAYIRGQKLTTGTNGSVYGQTFTGTSGVSISQVMFPGGGNQYNKVDASSFLGTSGDQQTATTYALTAYNEFVSFSWYDSSTINMLYNTSSLGISTSTYVAFTSSQLSFNGTVSNNYFQGGTLAGHNVLFVLLNSGQQITYCVINPTAYTYSTTLTAGVTPSNTTAISAAKGFSLMGVSSTAAPANGQGTVVINGPAQLNSNYSASTTGQNFDFRNPVTFGVSGVISGRNVNLIGNV